jgi:ADP-ribosylglycohydrolase
MSESIEHAQEGIEQAHHAAEHDGNRAAPRIAVLIATLAAGLALSEMAEKGAQNAYLTHHIGVSDDYSFFQAKNVRATIRDAQAILLESLPNAADPAIVARIKAARETEARLRDDPKAGDGMKQLAETARHRAEERDHAFHRYHLFETVVGALQIAIVLASVSVVTRVHWLAWTAGTIGLLAVGFGGLVALNIV